LKFREDSRFDRIILFLTPPDGRNVSDCDIVSVTSSTVSGNCHAKNAADLRNPTLAHTNIEPNSWICYDFKKVEVNVSHYSLHSRVDHAGDHLMNWKLEGSLDGKNWIELDVQNGCQSLNGINRLIRFVRIRQHGKNTNGMDHLTLRKFEPFGVLRYF
jgi:hypothetical protein